MRYIVRLKSSSGDWKSLPTMGSDNIVLVKGLDAKTTYIFKVNIECKAGRSV